MAARSSSKGPEKLFNTTVVFDPDGQEIARYRKMHLFDIIAPDGTGYRESATYGAGDEVVTYEADGVKVGCAICYDLRFPDLFWTLRQHGAELIFLPSAFTLATGKDHWEALIRGRAIETQCWFAAPATRGKHLEGKGEPRFTYGHSLVCDPWGHVVAQVSDGVGWATARIDRAVTTGCAATCRCWSTGSGCERIRRWSSASPMDRAVPDWTDRSFRCAAAMRRMPARRVPPPGRALWRLRADRPRRGHAGRRRPDAGDDAPCVDEGFRSTA